MPQAQGRVRGIPAIVGMAGWAHGRDQRRALRGDRRRGARRGAAGADGPARQCLFLVEDESPPEEPELLGLYDGVPLTERDTSFGGVLPDRIIIFRNPTLAISDTADDVVDEVNITVVHEIAHYFGLDDDRLHDLGYA